ncbi:MAG: chorismate mutase [Acidobacteria bacterium]|nr:MAG: chorismate mutase [Acidobacteriota bacterium]
MLPGSDLQAIREGIESVDRELLALLKRRMELVEQVAQTKLKRAFPFRDHEREERVLRRVRRAALRLGLDPHAVERLYRQIMEMSISHQQRHVRSLATVPLRVAYQGVEGSYSHLAAQRWYAGREGGALLTGFESCREAANAVRSAAADVALLPIENTTAGSINETYDLLAEGGLRINAEVVSKVEHCLVVQPGVKLDELRTVISHPQALLQCETYLRSVPWIRPVAEFDTAGAARKVKESNDPSVAAIASEKAAVMLGLEVLRKGIQSQASNATRFVEVAVEAVPCPPDAPCKTSLLVELDHSAGKLGELLMAFGRRHVQLSKLESRPVPDSPWKYRFYVDVEAHADAVEMVEALAEIKPLVDSLRVLGTYPRTEKPIDEPIDEPADEQQAEA